jgi:hypothetical protein
MVNFGDMKPVKLDWKPPTPAEDLQSREDTYWSLAGQIHNHLRQCGSFDFVDRDLYDKKFFYAWVKRDFQDYWTQDLEESLDFGRLNAYQVLFDRLVAAQVAINEY